MESPSWLAGRRARPQICGRPLVAALTKPSPELRIEKEPRRTDKTHPAHTAGSKSLAFGLIVCWRARFANASLLFDSLFGQSHRHDTNTQSCSSHIQLKIRMNRRLFAKLSKSLKAFLCVHFSNLSSNFTKLSCTVASIFFKKLYFVLSHLNVKQI
jgi:hypothetical protein